jgi:hypothetical protein
VPYLNPSRVLGSFLLLAAFPASAATVQVYLVAGQSNANAAVGAGVESTMNNWLGAANVDVVRSEHGGAPLWMWSSGGARGTHYLDDLAALDARFQAISATGDTPEFGGLIWIQGESDVFQPSTIGLYETRFFQMLDFYRDDLGLETVPSFTVGVIDANPDPSYDAAVDRGNVEAVRSVLFDIGSAPDGGAVDTRDLFRTDLWHLDTSSSSTLGNRLALDILGTNQVPEPSVAFLACAGFALSWRRRRVACS